MPRVYDALCVVHAAASLISRAAAIQLEQAASSASTLGLRRPPDWTPSTTRGPTIRQNVPSGSTEGDTDVIVGQAPVPNDVAASQPIDSAVQDSPPPIDPFPSQTARPVSKLPPIFQLPPKRPPPINQTIPALESSPPKIPVSSNSRPAEIPAFMTTPGLSQSAQASMPDAPFPSTTHSKPSPTDSIKQSYQAKTEYLPPLEDIQEERRQGPVVLKASKVPSTRIGRFLHYGSLAAGLTSGAASELFRRSTSRSTADPSTQANSVFMSEANVARLVDKLSQMRGAALKLGQFMSIQDAHALPEQIEAVLRKVQNMAHYMPGWQMEEVMSKELGADWKSHFETFETIPVASASIGQVHKATLSPSSPYYPRDLLASSTSPEPLPLAIKIQFPNIQTSIVSDIKTLSFLLSTTTPLLPKGLFMDSTLKAMQKELADECDYVREADCGVRFSEMLEGDRRFRIPRMIGFKSEGEIGGEWKPLTTGKVLVMEEMQGVPLGAAVKWEQDVRNEIARNILVLCLRELFHFRFMQTDPNWSNFLYNRKTRQIELIDFGATREYSKEFMDRWYLLLTAAINGDREAGLKYSTELGYLIGGENEIMVNSHLESLTLLGRPFSKATPQPFSFASNELPMAIRSLIPVMLENRLTPPPKETYSLNRKLSGALLLCGRLKAEVDCASVWEEVVGGYKVG